tara:strand:+ start:1784 stop:6445 length:4662 start_codon:yes stop_codon:yes gene_type:complete
MANLNEQTENTFYGFTPKGLEQETQKFILDPKEEQKRKEDAIKATKSIGTGIVTGALGLPSDLLDLATLANDLSADYAGNIVSKAVQPRLNELQQKYGRDAFDKAFTEVTGIKSDASDPAQLVGELISLGSVIKYGAKGVGAVAEGISTVADQTKKALQPKAVTPEGIAMPIPEQPKGGQVDEMIGGPEAIKRLYEKGVGKTSIDELKKEYPESMRPFISADTVKYDEYKKLQDKHNEILKNNDVDSIFKQLNEKEVEDVKTAAMSEFAVQYAKDNNLKVSDALVNIMFDADAPPVDFKKYLNKELVAKYLAQKRFAETGVYIGRASKKLKKAPMTEREFSQSQLRFEIPDVDATVLDEGINKLKTSPIVKLKDLLDHRLLYDAYGKDMMDTSYVGIEKRKDTRKYLESKGFPVQKRFFDPIGEIKIVPDPNMKKGTAAWYNEVTDTIGVDPSRLSSSVFRKDLLHEIQHAVQNREGFESGASWAGYMPSSIRNFENLRTGKPYNDETFEELYTLGARHSNFIDIIYSDVPDYARMGRIVRKPEIEAIKVIAQNLAKRMDAITKMTGQANFEQKFINSRMIDLERGDLRKIFDEVIQPEDFDLVIRNRNGVKIDGRKMPNTIPLKKTDIDGNLIADIDSDKTIKLNKKAEELFRKLPKDPEERMRLLKPFVEIALQEQMYNKAKSKALENYRLTAGELESQAVEARDAFAQRLIGQGKSKEDVIKELYKTHPMFKRSDYAFDKQRGLDVPEGVYPRKESDIVYFSEKFEETPVERATKETDDMLINMLGDEGIGAEHPNIQEAVNKYVYDVDKSSIEKAIASPDYPSYKADLQRILKKEFPDGKIPATRILNYASKPDGKKPKKVKSVLDIEDIAFAGNEAERELIANLNGDLTSFSIDNIKNQMNRGGVPTMQKKNIESQQLELFGGLKDQGGTKDPVSGNDVPVGSTKKEVRDDIPAQLSEGEFVLPADVVRYHGLEKIMGLRDQAKQGLDKMEAMGQMGNSDEATLPDDTPFMAQAGGVAGVNIQDPTQLQKQKSVFQTRSPYGQQPQMPPPFMPIIEPPKPPKVEAPATTPRTFKDTMGGTEFGQLPVSEQRQYKNTETGETKSFTFVNGKPVYPIPAGFVPIEEAGVEAPDVVKDVLVPTTQVTKEDKDRPSVSQVAGEGSFSLGNLNIGSLAGGALGSMFLGPLGGIIGSKIGGQLGQQDEVKPLTGDLNKNPLTKGYGNLSAAKQAMGSYKILGDATATGRVGTGVGDTDVNTRGIFNNSFSVATDISDLHKYGGAMRDANGHTVYRTINEQVKSLKAAAKTGWFGGPLSPMEYYGLTNDNKIKYNNYATEAGFTEQNYGTGKGSEVYQEFLNEMSKYNVSGTNQSPPKVADASGKGGDGYLVSNGKAYKGKYVLNKTTGDVQFEKEGGGTIISSGGSGLVGDLTGSGQKTRPATGQDRPPTETNQDAAIRRKQEAEAKVKADAMAASIRKKAEDMAEADRRKAEAEANRAKAREEAIAAKAEQRDRAIKESKDPFVSGTGMRRAKGGLMTKPTKKNVKRGGLASR